MPALLKLRRAPLTALALLPLAAIVATPQEITRQEGVLRITHQGQVLGKEKYRINPIGSAVEATAEIELEYGDSKVEQTTSMTLSRAGEPRNYQWKMKEPFERNIKVTFNDGRAVVDFPLEDGGRDRQEFQFNTGKVAVLDVNVFHHYILLIRLYDFAEGGPQRIPVLIPQSVQPGMLTVEDQGSEKITIGEEQIPARRLDVISTDNRIRLWVAEDLKLLRLEVPEANVAVEPEQ